MNPERIEFGAPEDCRHPIGAARRVGRGGEGEVWECGACGESWNANFLPRHLYRPLVRHDPERCLCVHCGRFRRVRR